MLKRKHLFKITPLVFVDILLFYAALFSGLLLRYSAKPDAVLIHQHLTPFTILFAAWLVMFGAFGLYDLRFMKNGKRFFYRIFKTMSANTVLAIVLFYLLPLLEIEPRRNLFIIVLLATFLVFAWRWLFNFVILKAPVSRLVFFGVNPETVELVDWLIKNPQIGQKPCAFVSYPDSSPDILPKVLPLTNYNFRDEDIVHVVKDLRVDTIVISKEIKENREFIKILFQFVPLGIAVTEFSSFYEALTGRIPLSLIGEVWFLENLVGIKKGFYEFFKRSFDMVLSVILSIPAAMMLPIVALAIKLDSRGSIFFKQKRAGKNGHEFELIKYRSMVEDAEGIGGFKGSGQDRRHTRVGSFLRKSYIDELPQIINIFKGEMSFIGPRPERPEYVKGLKEEIPFYEMRLLVPPGITGWAQVNMENDASVEDAPEKMQYDLYYIKNRSAVLDLLIVLRTIFTVLRRRGR